MKTEIWAWCGLDVAKKTFDVSLVLDQPLSDFAKVPTIRFRRDEHGIQGLGFWLADQLRGYMLDRQKVGFVMESTGHYSLELFDLLQNQEWSNISIINPRLASDFIKSLGLRNKTDRIDARALGFFGRERQPTPYQRRKPEYEQLRALVRYRRALINERTALRLRLESTQNKFVHKTLKRQLKSQERFLTSCEKEIKRVIKEYPSLSHDFSLLCSIIGVGKVTAWTVLAELGDLRRFETSRQLSSLAGTAPSIHESGTSVRRKSRLQKDCARAVREVLYMASLSATRHTSSPFSAIFQRMVKRGKAKKAAMCAIMRKMLVIMRAMLITGTLFNPEMASAYGKPVENVRKIHPKLRLVPRN